MQKENSQRQVLEFSFPIILLALIQRTVKNLNRLEQQII